MISIRTLLISTRFQHECLLFFWFSARLPRSGTCIGVARHAHGALYNQSYLFLAKPTELGLEKFDTLKPWEPITLQYANFSNFTDLTTYIFHNLNKSQAEYSRRCHEDNSCSKQPRLIAHLLGLQEEVDGFLYDRYDYSHVLDFQRWSFSEGDVMTSVFYNHELDRRALGVELVRNRSHFPEKFMMHSVHTLHYYTTDGTSHNEFLHYGHDPNLPPHNVD